MRGIIAIFAILILLAAALIFLFALHVFPFTTDSLIYVSTAQSISEGAGLFSTNIFVQPAAPDYTPIKLYPPGYSFLISFLDNVGVNVHIAALVIPRFFFLLLPIAFFLVFKHVMPKIPAIVTAGICSFMFPYLKCALMAWSDIPFLFLSLISFFFIFKAVKSGEKAQLSSYFWSGIFTGCSLLLRNVGYALALSIGLGLIIMMFLKILSFKKFLRAGLSYGAGVLVLFAPYLVRNYIVFGALNPYQLPPAHVTLTENLADYGYTLSHMIFAYPFYDWLLFILIGGMILWFILKMRRLISVDKETYMCASILILYFLSGSFLVLLSKSIFFMPEEINERYLIQYAWVIVAGLSYSVHCLLLKLKTRYPVDIKSVTGLILLAILLVQIFPAADFYFQHKKILRLAEEVNTSVHILDQIPPDHTIVSNVMDMTHFFSGRNVRMLNGYLPYGLSELLGTKRKFAVFIVKETDGTSRSYRYPPDWLNPDGYREVYSDRDVILWLPEVDI